MSSYVNPIASHSQVSYASRPAVQASAPAQAEAQQSAPSVQVNTFAINQILANAEGMIAAMIGMGTQDIRISVNFGRYDL